MYIIQNALLNLGKNKGRNILLFGIILAVITAVTVAIAIFNTANQVIEEHGNLFGRRVTISPARRQIGSGGVVQAESLSAELTYALAGLPYVERTNDGEIYYLHHPDLLGDFEAAARGLGLPDTFNVNTNRAEYERLIAPIERLGSVAFAFLAVVMLLGAIIISLLCIISVNERKYEIGILRAMGMKKGQVATGLMVEVVTITIAAFALAVWIGAALAGPISGMILDAESAIVIQTTLSLRSGLEILGLSVALAVVAGGVAVSRITKYEPSIILTERS
jgi:putative ABC transport system permease protein